MSILVIAEHSNGILSSSTGRVLQAAIQIGDTIDLLIAGYGCQSVVEQARHYAGVEKILVADGAGYQHQLAEAVAPLIATLSAGYSHVLAAASASGKNIMPRVAGMVKSQLVTDVLAVESADTFVRPMYAGNVYARVQVLDAVKLLLVRTTAFEPVAGVDMACPVENLDIQFTAPATRYLEARLSAVTENSLENAPVVVAGGRALGSSENFELLQELARELGGAVGASRAAVDAGYIANDLQVGQTGKIVAPELYIAVGISGAIQHLAGMKDSRVVVAINRDADAPIFDIADYGLVADLFEAVPELTNRLRESRAGVEE